MRRRWISLSVLLGLALMGPGASAHPTDPREYTFSGTPIALGAAHVYLGPSPIALFEFYAQPAGAVAAQAPARSAPTAITEPWVAAMYYPFTGSGYATYFGTQSAAKVRLDPSTGGVVSFTFPKIGTVRIELEGSSASPQTRPQGLTTPGGHHGHAWDIVSVLEQGKVAYVAGSIKRSGLTFTIRPLILPGTGHTAWIAQGATGRITTD